MIYAGAIMASGARSYRVIHRTAAHFHKSILGPVVALLDDELRDVRTSPESPALKAGRVVQLQRSRCVFPSLPPSLLLSRGNGPNGPFHPPFITSSHQSSVLSRHSQSERCGIV